MDTRDLSTESEVKLKSVHNLKSTVTTDMDSEPSLVNPGRSISHVHHSRHAHHSPNTGAIPSTFSPAIHETMIRGRSPRPRHHHHHKLARQASRMRRQRLLWKKYTKRGSRLSQNYIIQPTVNLVRWTAYALLLLYNICLLVIGLTVIVFSMMPPPGIFSVFLDDAESQYKEAIINLDMEDTHMEPDFHVIFGISKYIFILVGVFICCLSLLGCNGARDSHRLSLKAYCAGIIFLIVVQTVIVIVVKYKKDIRKTHMFDSLETYSGIEATNAQTKAWNILMNRHRCCGVTGYMDFIELELYPAEPTIKLKDNLEYNQTREHVELLKTPIICCKGDVKNITCASERHATPENNNMDIGCYDKLFESAFGRTFNRFIIKLTLSEVLVLLLGGFILGDTRNNDLLEVEFWTT